MQALRSLVVAVVAFVVLAVPSVVRLRAADVEAAPRQRALEVACVLPEARAAFRLALPAEKMPDRALWRT